MLSLFFVIFGKPEKKNSPIWQLILYYLFIYFSSPLILDQDQGSEVFLALSIWQKCPVWDTKTYSRLYYRHKINSPLIRSENFLNFIQNGLIKVRQKPERLQVQRKHELSKVVLAF